MSHFADAFAHVFGIEGDFSDDKDDKGGATRFGITERVARAHGYEGPMDKLPVDIARAIYRQAYWDIQKLDHVADLSYPIALELFDTGVNMGVGVAGSFLQRALNALNDRQSIYADMTVDGLVGMVTVSALRSYLQARSTDGEAIMLRALNALQGARYIGIAEGDESQEKWVYGWFRQRVK